MFKVIKEDRPTVKKSEPLKSKGEHNRIQLYSYEMTDGTYRYAVIDLVNNGNIVQNKIFGNSQREEAEEFFNSIRVRNSRNNLYLSAAARSLIIVALDTYGYKFWDYEGEEDYRPDGFNQKEFERLENLVSGRLRHPDVPLRLGRKERDELTDILNDYFCGFDGDAKRLNDHLYSEHDENFNSTGYSNDINDVWNELRKLLPGLYPFD